MKLSLPSLKSDLRDDESELGKLKGMNKSPVTAATAEKYAKDNGFKAYMECSAKNQKVKYQTIACMTIPIFFRVSKMFLIKQSKLS